MWVGTTGLPLAIVAIGGLLSKQKVISEWRKFSYSLGSELERNLARIKKIVLFNYNDLPHYLKSCFLCFGIIPEDYSISSGRLIRLWIAEGLVEERKGNTLEEVAAEYLTELIDRCLVQVSTTKTDGRVGECRVHDVVREIILSMLEEFSFSQLMEEENSSFNDTTRRLSMHMHYCSMDKVMESIIKYPVRSVFLFQVGELPKKPLLGTLAANFKLLKTLDLQDAPLDQLHEEVGNLFLLRYLSIRSTLVETIPKSIGKLQNLQTLDLKYSFVRELPFDISRLRKLRHLLAFSYNLEAECLVDQIVGVKIQGAIGGLEKLQSLRKLGITKLERKHGRALCAAIEKMKYLQDLSVMLGGRLEKLPDWIPKLQNLITLRLLDSGLTKNDPLKALQVFPSLLRLVLLEAYDGEQLYFEVGRFQKLKELTLVGCKGLNSVIIEEGALPLLEDLTIGPSPHLKEVPSGIYHLRNLKTLNVVGMLEEFIDRMEPKPNQGKDYWIVEHIPHVELWSRIEKQHVTTKIGSLEEYFNRKVENARVREDKNDSQS
ncbi:unnamed protein product [Camellia sinensis]